MLKQNNLVTAEMLHTFIQAIDNKEDVLFRKLSYCSHILFAVDVAENHKNQWEADDIPHLEQVKYYLEFLLQTESIKHSITYNLGIVKTLEKQWPKIKNVILQVLVKNLELFLKIPCTKAFKDIQHCGKILTEYADLLDTFNNIPFLNEEDANPTIPKCLDLLAQACDHICQQLWHAYSALDHLLGNPSNISSPIPILWIRDACLTLHKEMLALELGAWMHDRLTDACTHFLEILPEPNWKALSDGEKHMLNDVALANTIRKEMDETDLGPDDFPF